MEYPSHSVAQTEDFAARLGALMRPGAVLALWGGLGAGKTAFVRGLARGMGVRGRVNSPTFTLMHEHEGAVKLIHFDLYRLQALRDSDATGVAIRAKPVAPQGRASPPDGGDWMYHDEPYEPASYAALDELALEEWFGGPWVCAVEWPQNAGDLLPAQRLDVTLEAQGDDERRITLRARGAQYEQLLGELL